jgi:hypothetical protein
MPVEPAAPGPPPFWFQKEKLSTTERPPRSNVTFPLSTPDAETQEFDGIVAVWVAVNVRADNPLPFSVFTRDVPKPDPISVVAVTLVIRPAKA